MPAWAWKSASTPREEAGQRGAGQGALRCHGLQKRRQAEDRGPSGPELRDRSPERGQRVKKC